MKKLALLLLVCGLVVTIMASAASAGEKHKVYLITMDMMDQHWNNVDAGARKAVSEVDNIDYTWLAPDRKDDAKQIEVINNTVAAGAEAILLAANGPTAVTSALREAESYGVKIIYVDSPANFPSIASFATNNKAAGKTAGETILAALKAKGISSGSIGIVNINAATQSTVDREAGFREAFDGKGYTLLETQYGEGDVTKSKDIAANYLTQGVVGIFAANEGSTTGTGNAIQEDGNRVLAVGFDNSDSIRNLIRTGALIGAMVQNPSVMGYEAVKCASDVFKGGYKGPASVDTGVTVMTKEKL
ncbi:MAG: substrate-binding domain-containing protein [Planctomycetota bacterium]|jgi:ribose transport system substrate-binding protein|nr:substrate-binding domain-containing protein [Planctomycetota bacterium]